MISILLRKQKSEHWQCVTENEFKLKESKSKPKIAEKADPQDSLMTMMKQMYEDGS
jgi:hypothetical protein